jgi:hypothetical protein
VVFSFGHILQHICMCLEDHTQSIVPKEVRLNEGQGEIVDSLHGSKGIRMNRNKSNRGRGWENRRQARDSRRPSQATARQLRGHESHSS